MMKHPSSTRELAAHRLQRPACRCRDARLDLCGSGTRSPGAARSPLRRGARSDRSRCAQKCVRFPLPGSGRPSRSIVPRSAAGRCPGGGTLPWRSSPRRRRGDRAGRAHSFRRSTATGCRSTARPSVCREARAVWPPRAAKILVELRTPIPRDQYQPLGPGSVLDEVDQLEETQGDRPHGTVVPGTHQSSDSLQRTPVVTAGLVAILDWRRSRRSGRAARRDVRRRRRKTGRAVRMTGTR